MTVHTRNICKHGRTVSQCRCPADNKTLFLAACPLSCLADTPPTYHGLIGGNAYLIEEAKPSNDHEALVALIKRISPIKQEPLATQVAEEWAAEFEKEGWARGTAVKAAELKQFAIRENGNTFTLELANKGTDNRYASFEEWMQEHPIRDSEELLVLTPAGWVKADQEDQVRIRAIGRVDKPWFVQ